MPSKTKKALVLVSQIDSSDDSESSDSELNDTIVFSHLLSNRVKKRSARHRQRGYIQRTVSTFRLDEFKTFFRVSRTSIQCLKDYIYDVCTEKNISGILCRQSTGGSVQKPLEDRLLMLLWFMASLDKYASIADRFGVSESTACTAIHNLLQFIQENLPDKLIVWPRGDELQEIEDMYETLRGFPGVVGMIDGTHIKIKKPSIRGIDYYNRKSYYSVVLQGVVREDMRFTNVFAGYPGKVHDARIFRQSPLYQKGPTLCGPRHILGDSAYPNLPWLLTPFRDNGHLTDSQTTYNKTHSSIRCTVERAFGLMKGRFVRLQNIDQRDIQTVVRTMLTGCVLHNICIMNREEIGEVLQEDQVPQANVNDQNFGEHDQELGARKRLEIARRL